MIEYNKEITLTDCNGYKRFYDVEHPLCLADGMVYYHRHIASMKLGRWIEPYEHVHHIDGDRSNNDPENLIVLTVAEHNKAHSIRERIIITCAYCGEQFETYRVDAIYCSVRCMGISKRKFDPSKEELEQLVWEIPTSTVAKLYGVCDVAVAKRCRVLGIEKPPRGYWQKKRSNNAT